MKHQSASCCRPAQPTSARVRLDRGFVFCECELQPDVGVHVAVGHVVHDLPDGPSAGPVRVSSWASVSPLTARRINAGREPRSSMALLRTSSVAGVTGCRGPMGSGDRSSPPRE